MWQRKFFIVVIVICSFSIQYSLAGNMGYTIPGGDIDLEYGKGIINITCYITNETIIQERIRNNNVTNFDFRIGKKKLPENQIERLNATAIRYINAKPEIMTAFISCTYNGSAVGVNSVIVGTKPQNVTDFDCIGYDLVNMTCTWSRDRSQHLVSYNLSYHFGNPALQSNCSKIEEEKKDVLFCFWNSSQIPYYRPSHEKFHFILIGRNKLGVSNQTFEIDHYQKVKTSPPINLIVDSVTISSFHLKWEIPYSMSGTHVFLKHRIMYTYQNSGFNDFKVAATLVTSCRSRVVSYNLTDLPFAYTLYDIRVGMRMNKSESEDMWSANNTLTNFTAATLPGAPIANINGFYNSSGTVIIYWKQLERLYQNGPNFTYIVENKNLVEDNTVKTTDGYLKLTNLNSSQSYTFEIHSQNDAGISSNFSRVIVPALDKPKMVMDYPVLKEYSPTQYQLSWTSPRRGAEHLVNYTVYWCEKVVLKVTSSHLCSNVNWVTLPKDVMHYNITISEKNNVAMAISANGIDESTSMIWAECTVRHDKPLQKISNIFEKADATTITIKWTVKCLDKTKSIDNYYVEYCPTNGTERYCKGDRQNQSITTKGGYDEEVTISNLEPYTTYFLQILMNDTQGSFAPATDPLYVTTLEGTPSTPYDLKIVNETNSSIYLEWLTPQKENSRVIRYFEIKYNNMTAIVNRTIKIESNPKIQNFNITRLNGYETYNISIRACIAAKCSAYTPTVSGKTKIGSPGKVDKIHFNSLNNTVTWEKPSVAGGKLDYYEIEVEYDGSKKPINQKLKVMMYPLEKCGENSPYSTVSYKVRAVNYGEEKQVYTGVWSDEDKQQCQNHSDSMITVFIVVSLFIFGMMFTVIIVFGKRCYIYFITMKDVQFKLPEGLYDNKDHFPRNNEVDYIKEPPGDDQFLLYDKDGVKRSGDSSGCSSGQDSAESDSGTSLSSTTDSGTEQLRPKDDDLVEAVALEDFNLSNSGKGGPYCQLGYPNSDAKQITPFSFPKDIPYIRSNESASSSDISPYIRCDQIAECEARPINSGYVSSPMLEQMTSSGYVPHPVEEKKSGYVPHSSTDKNSGYVMAADKNSIMPNAENKGYVQVADANNTQMPNEDPPRSNGYVSYGDVKSLPASPDMKSSTPYVSHKQLDEVLNKN